MELSLCMIVRDEESRLGRCLESVRDTVDEIVILDTGSADGTKAIARRYTDRVYDYAWKDDFADARNTSFSYASKPFILWLDADDVLDPGEAEKLLALKARLDDGVDAVMLPYAYAYGPDGRPSLVFERERIVRRAAGFAFSGVVHEAMAVGGNVLHEEFHELMRGFHLCQFRAFLARGGNHAVAAEVALMRAGKVVARVQAANAFFQFERLIDGLVYPVPDAAADAGVGTLDNVPIFLEVADGVAHSVGIFADKHRLVEVARVLLHPCHAGVHL